MPLARLPQMGFSLAVLSPAGISPIVAVLNANAPFLDEYKRAGGDTRPGVSVTLRNGVQGHFTEEGLFQIDYTPPEFAAAARAAAPPPPPSNSAPFINLLPPGAPPGYPAGYPPAPGSKPPPEEKKPFFGIPPLVLVGAGGLVIYLVARRF